MLELAKSFVPILADLAVEEQWAERHNVVGIPVVVYTDSSGEMWASTIGLQPTETVLEDMQSALDGLSGDDVVPDPEDDMGEDE